MPDSLGELRIPLGNGTSEGGGAAAPGVGDYVTWFRSGGVDGDSGTFDYVADIAASSGTTIIADDSAGTVSGNGYPTPKVTETGLYRIDVRVIGTGTGSAPDTVTASVSFYSAAFSGIAPTPLPVIITTPDASEHHAEAKFTTVRHLVAGSFVDVSPDGADAVDASMAMTIQRVA